MDLDKLYNPTRNAYLTAILGREGFDFKGLEPREVSFGAVLERSREDLVIMLKPATGTGVIEHASETAERVKYLGQIVRGDEALALFHKFQDDLRTERTSGNDVVLRHSVGAEFVTIAPNKPGRWHGFHNPYAQAPIALLIHKEFGG